MRNLPNSFLGFHNITDVLDGFLKEATQYRGHEVLRVDIKEDNEKYTLHADVPGVEKEDIKVNFDKGILSIEVSERKAIELKEGETLIKTERLFKQKYRSFELGDSVDESKVEAEYKNGVLVLVLPKKESLKVTKQIEIK